MLRESIFFIEKEANRALMLQKSIIFDRFGEYFALATENDGRTQHSGAFRIEHDGKR